LKKDKNKYFVLIFYAIYLLLGLIAFPNILTIISSIEYYYLLTANQNESIISYIGIEHGIRLLGYGLLFLNIIVSILSIIIIAKKKYYILVNIIFIVIHSIIIILYFYILEKDILMTIICIIIAILPNIIWYKYNNEKK
jgi:hypothetical protein